MLYRFRTPAGSAFDVARERARSLKPRRLAWLFLFFFSSNIAPKGRQPTMSELRVALLLADPGRADEARAIRDVLAEVAPYCGVQTHAFDSVPQLNEESPRFARSVAAALWSDVVLFLAPERNARTNAALIALRERSGFTERFHEPSLRARGSRRTPALALRPRRAPGRIRRTGTGTGIRLLGSRRRTAVAHSASRKGGVDRRMNPIGRRASLGPSPDSYSPARPRSQPRRRHPRYVSRPSARVTGSRSALPSSDRPSTQADRGRTQGGQRSRRMDVSGRRGPAINEASRAVKSILRRTATCRTLSGGRVGCRRASSLRAAPKSSTSPCATACARRRSPISRLARNVAARHDLASGLRSSARRKRLTESDIQLFDLKTQDQNPAIAAGDVDAVVEPLRC